jgi:rhodanese-related sulfurtransferase
VGLFDMTPKITPAEMNAMMREPETYTLIDVRGAQEFAQGHIPGALNIPAEVIATRAAAELPDKSATIILYCHSGMRASMAAKQLQGMGYQDVRNLGGIINWPYETTR